MDYEKIAAEIQNWIREKVKQAGARGVVIGLSGGIDSSCTAVLCKKALKENVLGLTMPCHSDPLDERHAILIAEKFDIRREKIDLTSLYDKFLEILPDGDLMAKSNLKPRLRMVTLYFFANANGYLVCGSGNKSELTVGYFTKYGDGGVDLLPLGGLYKTQVRKLARMLGIPKEIIEKSPSAGLWEGQTDEGELGITYESLDKILRAMDEEKFEKIEKKDIENIKEMIKKSDHKRKMPEIFDIRDL